MRLYGGGKLAALEKLAMICKFKFGVPLFNTKWKSILIRTIFKQYRHG